MLRPTTITCCKRSGILMSTNKHHRAINHDRQRSRYIPSCYRYRSSTSSSNTTKSTNTSTASTASSSLAEDTTVVLSPTARQLTMHALKSAIPMIGFGFMDNTIMIHAGHYVDCTLGVTFGLSTLAAAGIGQIFSGIGGVIFGDGLDALFHKISGGTNMTRGQRAMRKSRIVGLTGGVIGVTIGCALGLVNLLFVDETKASLLKLQALEDGQEFEFEVEVDNEIRPGYTTVRVRGPDVDGVLASITASIASIGCSVVELHAENRAQKNQENGESILEKISQSQSLQRNTLEDVFIIRDRSTQLAIDDEDLDELARTVLAAARDPLNSHSLKGIVEELQVENDALVDRISVLEGMLEDRQIKVVKTTEKQDAS